MRFYNHKTYKTIANTQTLHPLTILEDFFSLNVGNWLDTQETFCDRESILNFKIMHSIWNLEHIKTEFWKKLQA